MPDLRLYTELAYQKPLLITDVKGNRTSRLETIANKVVKYILTDKGSDMVDPTYGSFTSTQNYNELQRITYDFSNTLSSCIEYIKRYEQQLPSTTEKLKTVNLLSIEVVDRSTLKIRISILTTFNNYALLDVKK